MASITKSGIKTTEDGSSVIPASKRADGSTRKEIKVRPGYQPPEDVETYKNRTAEAWKNRGSGGVPGADYVVKSTETETKSKNAKRREAAKKKVAAGVEEQSELSVAMSKTTIDGHEVGNELDDSGRVALKADGNATEDSERQKKIRNTLKKLKAIRELKEKKVANEKLSPDQLMKISKESELIRDLERLGYDGHEIGEEDQRAVTASTNDR